MKRNNNSQDNNKRQFKRYSIIRSRMNLPYPPPSLLKDYNNIDPGAGKSIIQNGLKESEHRRNIDNERMYLNKRTLNYSTKYNITSLWMGFVISLFMIVATVILVITNHYVIGLLTGAAALSLIGMFVPKERKIHLKKNK